MVQTAASKRTHSRPRRVVLLLSGGIGLAVFSYLTVTAIPALGLGDAVPMAVSRALMTGILLAAIGVSLVVAYQRGHLTWTLTPLVAMALGMSAFLVVDELFALGAVEADLPIQFGVVFYVVTALLLGALCYLVGRGGRWLRSRARTT